MTANSSPNFIFGFELEGCLREAGKGMSNLWRELFPIYNRDLTGYDCHYIEHGFRPAEIRTPPLPMQDALTKLDQLLDVLKKYSVAPASGVRSDWYTDRGCGLHINMSEPSACHSVDKQVKFWQELCVRYPEWAVARAFGRQDNRNNSFNWRENASEEEKRRGYPQGISVVNKVYTESWMPMAYLGSTRRLEFRAHGGDNYHLKRDEINFAIKAIVDAATAAYYVLFPAPVTTPVPA